jgi:phosphatidate cytidylyltransferase
MVACESDLVSEPETPAKPRSDLGVRAVSAIVMVAIAAAAFWLGGNWFTAFLLVIAVGLLWEWWGLVSKLEHRNWRRLLWMLGGLVYIGWPCLVLNSMWVGRWPNSAPMYIVAYILPLVIFVDIGAYAAGRTFGGPKIAPSISPSKTWSGLAGGVVATMVWTLLFWLFVLDGRMTVFLYIGLVLGSIMACVAQAGDFFESWMKRRAGVKDSGNLIPGHGGLLDRLDGHLAVISFTPFALGVILRLPL